MALTDFNTTNNPTIDPRLGEVGVEDDSFVQTDFDDGSTEFDFDEERVNQIVQEGVVNLNENHYSNLTEEFDESVLNEIAADVIDRYEGDQDSREAWLETVSDGLNLLGLEVQETDDPFPGACSAHHPMILEAAVKFQAKASNELFSAKGPVRTQVVGEVDEEKDAQSQRIRNHLNYQIMDQMTEYFDEAERLLFYLPIVGSGFKKTYYSAILDRPVSEFIPVDQFVVNYQATNLQTASCFTHSITRLANDLKKDQINGLYREIDLVKPTAPTKGTQGQVVDDIMGVRAQADDEVYPLVEQYCYLDLEEDPLRDPDGIALPYVVTVEENSTRVLSIRRNWREEDPLRIMICPFTHYKFVPGMGFYGLGFLHLLGNLQMTLTATMRSLIDSGTFANLQGGFVDKRLRVRSGLDGPLSPGEYREVESGGLPLKDAILPLQFKEPSLTLLDMFKHIEARGQKFADSTEQVVSDASNYGPVGTTMALLEASAKFFSGVHKRLHKAQKHEFKILASLNYEYLEESETFDVVGNTFSIKKEDYDGRIDVLPVSDPNVGSQAQKLTLSQAVLTNAQQERDIHDMYAVSKYYYGSLGIDDDEIDRFLPKPEEAIQGDPISDLMNAQKGKPISAFPGQDHEAHITIKMAFMEDPKAGGNPAMGAVMPVIQANIQEHVIMKFQESVQGAAQGAVEEQAIAQAAQQVSQQNQRIQELEAVGPDEARAKLAENDQMRVVNEGTKLEMEALDKAHKRSLEEMRLALDKYKVDMASMNTQMQEQANSHQLEMKNMLDLIKEAGKIEHAADVANKQIKLQEKQIKSKPVDKKSD